MKFLFITNDLGYIENANSSIAMILCNELREKNEIEIFSCSSFVKNRNFEYKGYKVYSFGPFFGEKSLRLSRDSHIRNYLGIMKRPHLWVAYLRIILYRVIGEKYSYFESRFAAKKIKSLYRINKYDMIYALSEPYMSIYTTARLNQLPITIIQLDPYHTNRNKDKNESQWRLKKEFLAYQNARKIFMTKLMKKEYLNTKLAEFRSNWITFEFPLIRQPEKGYQKHTLTFMPNKIICLYCGTLDMEYRNPKYALELAKQLGDDYRFYFIGRNCVELIEQTMKVKDYTVVTHDAVSSEEIHSLMASADFLVNIGNTMTNQMPSKIIDYISTGKPILNFIKNPDCATKEYTSQYELALDVHEYEPLTKDLVNKIDEFCKKHKGQTIPFSEIEKKFYKLTPKYVAGIISGDDQ